jgi:glycosyltransferase involved in cell wall biosynthesis
MSTLQNANNLFKAGRFQDAINVYETIKKDSPHLVKICEFNLQLAKKKLNETTEADPSDKSQINLQPAEISKITGQQIDPLLTKNITKPTSPNDQTLIKPVGKKILLNELYTEVQQAIDKIPNYVIENEPLVTVLMTTHNVEEYVAEAIMSLLRQSYLNLEVVIVDDCSTDKTREILERLKNASPKVKIKYLNTNLGTYFAKNYGFTVSKGDYIFFQDGDDICHPERIKLSMMSLIKENIMCVRSCYSRVIYPEGKVLAINDLVKKLGVVTTGYRRQVFKDIGFFNCTSKASDDEFFNRARAFYDRKQFVDVSLPLYYNTYREGSLFTDMVSNDPNLTNTIEQVPSPSRQKYAADFTNLHKTVEKTKFKDLFKFPMIRDPIPVTNDMTNLPNPKIPVIGNICTFPARSKSFKITVENIVKQLDEINIYLDKYEDVPEFLNKLPIKTNIFRNKDYPNLRDNGKLLGLSHLKGDCYYFTFDDDIEYPPDYVNAMIRKIEEYERSVIVGVHGVLIPEIPSGYFSSFRMVYTFMKKLESDRLVNNLGTGTVAFHSNLSKGLTHEFCKNTGMLDIYFSVYCKKNNIPMVCIARHDGWMGEIKQESNEHNLFAEYKSSDPIQTELIKSNLPWGYSGIVSNLNNIKNEQLLSKLKLLIPDLHQVLV